ncbi:hypothetical protein EK21DRAFT_85645 [Setomelanomma holmii]|uniref:Uncharacterized protein n=1 Tax=Setomelanomma holmii TaxID=210430 RepID=A0A9P4HH71_9PLEO|nr:hypothetical protein EK21DRAFT_85645 [Setomelanomma holmii]
MADILKQPSHAEEQPPSETLSVDEKPYNWYYGVFFQATVVGCCAFAAPGLWNAMQSDGAGGQQTPYLVMAGNALLFALMTFTCLSGSIVINHIGLRYTLALGTTGYTLYSAALYQNNRYGTEWFIYIGSAACGITAGLFWATEGAIMLSYPPSENRGKYLAYWLAYRNSGATLGGAINLAFNYSGKRLGKLNWETYIVMSRSCCCDATFTSEQGSAEEWDESQATSQDACEDRVEGNEQADASQGVPISCSVLPLCDVVTALHWLLHVIVLFCPFIQHKYQLHKPALDWDDSAFGEGWALYTFQQVDFALTYNYGYWMLGFLAKKPAEVVRYTSVARGFEAAGQCVASGISSTKTPLIMSTGLILAWWGITLPLGFLVVRKVGIEHVGAEGYVPEVRPSRTSAGDEVSNVHKV